MEQTAFVNCLCILYDLLRLRPAKYTGSFKACPSPPPSSPCPLQIDGPFRRVRYEKTTLYRNRTSSRRRTHYYLTAKGTGRSSGNGVSDGRAEVNGRKRFPIVRGRRRVTIRVCVHGHVRMPVPWRNRGDKIRSALPSTAYSMADPTGVARRCSRTGGGGLLFKKTNH